ncbi:peptidoglycan endopeptidase RipA precursor [Rhodococcus sp. Br-6]|nr:peptidoglycan endopeptidase RipA precursor [Rhodococcus sp. Br-6]
MWVVAGKVASAAAKKAVKTVASKPGGGEQTPKKKRLPLYLAAVGVVLGLFAIALLIAGSMISAFFAAIAGTTTSTTTNCGVDRGRLSAFGEQGGSLAGVRAGSLAIPMAQGTYTLTSGWGMRDGGMHNGTDFGADSGTPFYAAADGVVTEAGPASGYGNWIIVRHNLNGQTVDTLYGHMYDDGVLVKVGDQVRGGQHIGNVGSAGDSSGPHLHLSLHPGGYAGYNSGVDALPWLEQDLPADPGPGKVAEGFTQVPSGPNTPSPGDDPFLPLTQPGNELAALPADKGTEAGAQVDAVRVMRIVNQMFPEITTIGGLRPGDSGAHGAGRAVDIMIPDWQSPTGIELGDKIVAYFQTHKDALNVEDLIWQQRYWSGADWSDMDDRGTPTENHYDHVHVTVAGGGTPNASTIYGAAPGASESTASAILATNSTTSTADCIQQSTGSGEGLAEGSVPDKYRAAILRAGTVCPDITSPLIAAQIEQESGWREDVVSAGDGVNSGGAQGFSQFMPGTWVSFGVDSGLDKNGRPDAPNAPDPFNPFDAIAAQAKYMCYIVDVLRPHIDSGKVKGDVVDLALAGYNAGEGAVIEFGGIPPFGQTQAYVPEIKGKMTKYTSTLSPQQAGPGGPEITVAGSPFARAMIAAASRHQGLPYVWGGGTPTGPSAGDGRTGELGFDCSGLVQYAVAQASNQRTILARGTWDQVNQGVAVSANDIQPGDAVFSNGIGHVAIWLGDGKVLEAQTFGVPVGVYPFDLNNAENIRRYG